MSTIRSDTRIETPRWTTDEELLRWLSEQAQAHALPYLLAHADDGIVWGRRGPDGSLTFPGSRFKGVGAALRLVTLQQARLFGPQSELFLWRTQDGFAASLRTDASLPSDTYLETQTYVLWGEAQATSGGFTLMHEGQQGMRHAIPLELPTKARAALAVRHYVAFDHGQAYIAASRLLDLVRL